VCNRHRDGKNLSVAWLEKFEDEVHGKMLQCKGFGRSLFLRIASEHFFHRTDGLYDFSNPAWYLLAKDPVPHSEQYTDDVLDFLRDTGGVVQEIFGMNLKDLLDLDPYTYSQVKKATFAICEERAKAAAERDQAIASKLKDDQRRLAEQKQGL
jgi:hypothetical protein